MPPGPTHITQSKLPSSFGIHPLTITHRMPCGFCFVEYYSHAEALACMPYVSEQRWMSMSFAVTLI